jgi:hypothetical protein
MRVNGNFYVPLTVFWTTALVIQRQTEAEAALQNYYKKFKRTLTTENLTIELLAGTYSGSMTGFGITQPWAWTIASSGDGGIKVNGQDTPYTFSGGTLTFPFEGHATYEGKEIVSGRGTYTINFTVVNDVITGQGTYTGVTYDVYGKESGGFSFTLTMQKTN